MKIFKGLLLGVLSLTQLFYEVLLHTFQLIHLILNLIDGCLSCSFLRGILLGYILPHLGLGESFVLQELSLMLFNLNWPVSLEVEIEMLFRCSSVEIMLFALNDLFSRLLIHREEVHLVAFSLLLLKISRGKVLGTRYVLSMKPLLLERHFFLKLALMTISSIQ